MVAHFPKYFTQKAIYIYVLLLILCSIAFFKVLPALWITFGLIEVALFFAVSNSISKSWNKISALTFRKKLFRWSLMIRLIYVVFMYFFYEILTGTHFEFDAGDSAGYHELAAWVSTMIEKNDLTEFYKHVGTNYSDMGYPYYLAVMYYVFGQSILLIRIIKAILGAITCVLIFKLATRNFGETVGRIAGILCMLSPNLIYYCGLHVKETEMIFLTVVFFERADSLLHSKRFTIQSLIIISTVGISLFFFRTVLAVSAFFSFGLALLFAHRRTISIGKKVNLYIWIGLIAFFVLGGTIQKNIDEYIEKSDTNQKVGMASRTIRKDGNRLATYGSTVIFAPLVFVGPFPTLVNIETQQNQMLLNGGYFVRNILGFFFFLSLFVLYKEKLLRSNLLLLGFIISYLFIIAMSTFALAERFHLPVLPFISIFAAHGITQVNAVNKNKYILYLTFLSVLVISWNWFKLAGRF